MRTASLAVAAFTVLFTVSGMAQEYLMPTQASSPDVIDASGIYEILGDMINSQGFNYTEVMPGSSGEYNNGTWEDLIIPPYMVSISKLRLVYVVLGREWD